MTEMLVVKSKVRDYVKKKKMNLGGDATAELGKEIASCLIRLLPEQKQIEGAR